MAAMDSPDPGCITFGPSPPPSDGSKRGSSPSAAKISPNADFLIHYLESDVWDPDSGDIGRDYVTVEELRTASFDFGQDTIFGVSPYTSANSPTAIAHMSNHKVGGGTTKEGSSTLSRLPLEIQQMILEPLLAPFPRVIRIGPHGQLYVPKGFMPWLVTLSYELWGIGMPILLGLNAFEFAKSRTMMSFLEALNGARRPSTFTGGRITPAIRFLNRVRLYDDEITRCRRPQPDMNQWLAHQAFGALTHHALNRVEIDFSAMPKPMWNERARMTDLVTAGCSAFLRCKWDFLTSLTRKFEVDKDNIVSPKKNNDDEDAVSRMKKILTVFEFTGTPWQKYHRGDPGFKHGGVPMDNVGRTEVLDHFVAEVVRIVCGHSGCSSSDAASIKNAQAKGEFNVRVVPYVDEIKHSLKGYYQSPPEDFDVIGSAVSIDQRTALPKRRAKKAKADGTDAVEADTPASQVVLRTLSPVPIIEQEPDSGIIGLYHGCRDFTYRTDARWLSQFFFEYSSTLCMAMDSVKYFILNEVDGVLGRKLKFSVDKGESYTRWPELQAWFSRREPFEPTTEHEFWMINYQYATRVGTVLCRELHDSPDSMLDGYYVNSCKASEGGQMLCVHEYCDRLHRLEAENAKEDGRIRGLSVQKYKFAKGKEEYSHSSGYGSSSTFAHRYDSD